ncbi:methyltransferase domain-containing protein [Paraburkholderia sp. JPY432]|uniref:methyltransferase domain-containing protein n=1 Tax=Paraburkholderia youngii TaxID=2782701 RepID=UPI0015955183|nr:methyltransferase domain-containing protein [Paraburkholderia youngii]NVH73584.1 methyltransferase domain-containing protein [Paraburkholderia youngii]
MTNAVLQDLIARVKAEAAAHAGPSDTTATAALGHAVSPAGAELDVAGLCAPASIEQLMIAEDEAFVDGAYRLVLRRESDPAGRANYVGQLKNGASRLVLLAKLRMSEEGRRTGVQVPGLRLGIGVTLAQRVLRHSGLSPLASRVGRYADGVYARRLLSRSLVAWRSRFENTVGAVMRQAARSEELSRRVDDLQVQFRKGLAVAPEIIDAYYLAFEDANRGTRENVRAKLAIYDDWLATNVPRAGRLTHQIVDIGCGRGEWLSYVRERGHDAIGIDVSPVMVKACIAQGFDARHTDALKYLRSLPTGSVAAVTGFHIIEHLPFDYLFALVQESYRVLVEGGSVLFETPNPENILVGSHTFYHDFTHRNPITPSAITFLLKYHHFEAIDIIRSSPYPEEAKVPGNDPLTERVNGHLCGPQDFAVYGRKRTATGAPA